MSDYFIKPGYRPNKQVKTLEQEAGEYWNASRIQKSLIHQYYVYKKALSVFQRQGYTSVMDVGSGPANKMQRFFASVCQDITLIDQPSVASLVEQTLPQAQFLPVNLEDIDLKLPRSFDLIICSDVLEHLENPTMCLDFIRSHLRSQGRVILSTPERDYAHGPQCDYSPNPVHIREWNRIEFANYVKSRGFNIAEHIFLPGPKLDNRWEFWLSRLLANVVHNRRWSSCQTLVCTID
jgi:SAM-dependent methyltransferase